MCIDHRWAWAYDYARSDQVLKSTNTREDAQAYFQYWDRSTDKVHQWSPADGNFDAWLASLDAEATQCWETHAQTSANMVIYNKGQWGPQYATFNPRGQYLTWPGAHGSAWIDGEVTEVWEVPRGAQGIVQIPQSGIDGTGYFSCFYYAE